MKYFFSPEGDQALRETLRLETLLAFDYDGTLAPITDRHESASTPPAIVHSLAQLANQAKTLIITGRSIKDVSARLGFTPHTIIGNHGAESLEAPCNARHVELIAGWRTTLETICGATLRDAGVVLEDKGYSLALHYRQARDPAAARQCIMDACARLSPPAHIFSGKCVVNIAPNGAPNKADALFATVQGERAEAAIFVGDDQNDEIVFERAPAHWLTVRVGYDPHSRAHFYLERQDEMLQFIETILKHLPGR